MPIYAFACRACGHQFDRLQKLSDPDPRECPACGAVEIQRQVTAPSFRLAGSGWYETDFKKDGEKRHNLADSREPTKSESGSSTANDSTAGAKPAADKPASTKPAADAATSAQKSTAKADKTST